VDSSNYFTGAESEAHSAEQESIGGAEDLPQSGDLHSSLRGIDTLCIDQSSVERNQQLGMMGDVYTPIACEGLAWTAIRTQSKGSENSLSSIRGFASS
jgi:hypothetical protein